MYYIQRRDNRHLETVDEFDTRSEAVKMVREYQLSDPAGHYYVSTRPCREWAES